MDAILIGLEKIASLTDRCTIYILLYLHVSTLASLQLEKSVLRLFTAILKFLANAIYWVNGGDPDKGSGYYDR